MKTAKATAVEGDLRLPAEGDAPTALELIPGSEWSPWAAGDDVAAWTNGVGTLFIVGSGKMSDFASVEDVPWNGVKIEKVTIGEDVEQIGKNALSMIDDDVEVNGTPLSTYRTVTNSTTVVNGMPLDDFNEQVRFLNEGVEWQTGPVPPATDDPSGAISADFTAVKIVDGKVYLCVGVCTNGELTATTEGWGATDVERAEIVDGEAVLTIPATAEKGFMILKTKPTEE